MTGEIRHLANNERYRLLIIDGETYIMDIERSFWKIIFPFLFWLLPNYIFKVSDQEIVAQLQTEKMKRKGVSGTTAATGFSYAMAISLAPLMGYFNIPMPYLTNIILLFISVTLISIWYYILSRSHKQKLYDVIVLEKMTKEKLWICPSSISHLLYVLFAYIFLIGANLFLFLVYVESKNIIILIIATGFLFLFLITNRKTIREGKAKVKFKG